MSKIQFIYLIFLYILFFYSSIINSSNINNNNTTTILEYTRYKIPLTPTATLKIGEKLEQGESLQVGNLKLYISDDGMLKLSKCGKEVWSSEPPTKTAPSYFLINYEQQLMLRGSNGAIVWNACTLGLGGQDLTIFENEYNREFGIVLLNKKGKMVWGRFGQLLTHNQDALIPGSFLDNKDGNNSGLATGEFITNGRDYLYMGRDGVVMLFNGNPNGDDRGAQSVYKSIRNQYFSTYGKYKMNFEAGGTMVIYSSLVSPFLYRVPTNGQARYLQLPIPDPTYSKAEWSIISRDESGQIVWGHFGNPKESESHKYSYASQYYPSPTLNKDLTLNGSYLQLNINPRDNEFFLNETYMSISTSQRMSLLEGKESNVSVYNVSENIQNMFKDMTVKAMIGMGFNRDGKFQVYIRGIGPFFIDILFETKIDGSYKNNFLYLYNQLPAILLLDCGNYSNCGENVCGCQLLWSKSYSLIIDKKYSI